MIDIYAPAAPGSLMRAHMLAEPGVFRLARRDCELYSVQLVGPGDWGRLNILTGAQRPIMRFASTFTGSFWLSAGLEDGLIAEMIALNTMGIEINWREPDRKLV